MFFRHCLLHSASIGKNRTDAERYPEVMEVDSINGMALAFPSAVLRRIGGFDPRYFVYGEEDDLSFQERYL
jgi:GT2 family glycosyltransferase